MKKKFEIGDTIKRESTVGTIIDIVENGEFYVLELIDATFGHNMGEKYKNKNHWLINARDEGIKKIGCAEIRIREVDGKFGAQLIGDGEIVDEIWRDASEAGDVNEFIHECLPRLDEAKEEFVPHLEWWGKNLGEIGKSTEMKDVHGERLFTGDVVTVVDDCSQNHGLAFVCEDNDGQFIMGLKDACLCGRLKKYFTIIKEKSWRDLSNGEEYNNIAAVLEDD